MRKYTIELPYPSPVLSPNYRAHWAVVSSAKKQMREQAKWRLCEAMGHKSAQWDRANVYISAHPRDRRKRDADNLLASLKAAFDGAQDSGLIQDDSGLTYWPITWSEPDKHNPRVVITFCKDQADLNAEVRAQPRQTNKQYEERADI